MTDEVSQWLAKSGSDFRSARLEAAAREPVNVGLVLFLCQQSIEKLLKANLIAWRRVPPFIHDLVTLSRQLGDIEPGWYWEDEDTEWLTRGAVMYRYPNPDAAPLNRGDADQAIDLAERLRSKLLPLLDNR